LIEEAAGSLSFKKSTFVPFSLIEKSKCGPVANPVAPT